MQSSQDGCNTDVTREYEWSCGSTERCTFTVARISSSDESIIPASIHILWHQIVNMEHGDLIDEQVCRGVGWERTWQINEKNTPRINWMPLTFLTTCQSFVDKTNLFSKQRVKRHPPEKKNRTEFFFSFLSSISWSRWSVLNESRSINWVKLCLRARLESSLSPSSTHKPIKSITSVPRTTRVSRGGHVVAPDKAYGRRIRFQSQSEM